MSVWRFWTKSTVLKWTTKTSLSAHSRFLDVASQTRRGPISPLQRQRLRLQGRKRHQSRQLHGCRLKLTLPKTLSSKIQHQAQTPCLTHHHICMPVGPTTLFAYLWDPSPLSAFSTIGTEGTLPACEGTPGGHGCRALLCMLCKTPSCEDVQ